MTSINMIICGASTNKIFLNRRQDGEFYTLVPDLQREDGERHHIYFRMSKVNFFRVGRVNKTNIKTSNDSQIYDSVRRTAKSNYQVRPPTPLFQNLQIFSFKE
jgi:hypothetical protein